VRTRARRIIPAPAFRAIEPAGTDPGRIASRLAATSRLRVVLGIMSVAGTVGLAIAEATSPQVDFDVYTVRRIPAEGNAPGQQVQAPVVQPGSNRLTKPRSASENESMGPPVGLFRTFAKNLPMAEAATHWGRYELGRRLSLTLVARR
jgi:hypothetical protein